MVFTRILHYFFTEYILPQSEISYQLRTTDVLVKWWIFSIKKIIIIIITNLQYQSEFKLHLYFVITNIIILQVSYNIIDQITLIRIRKIWSALRKTVRNLQKPYTTTLNRYTCVAILRLQVELRENTARFR